MLSVPPVNQPAGCPELELEELLELELDELLELELELEELLELELEELLPPCVPPPQPSIDMTGAATNAELNTLTTRLREACCVVLPSLGFFMSVIGLVLKF